MIITRRIEVFICEDDKDLRKEYYDKLYKNRDTAVKIANMGISHMFMLDNTTPYLSDEDRERLEYLGCPKADGHQNKATKRNAPYVAASIAFKGEADMGMASCLLQEVGKAYQDDRKKGMWNKSLRSYKGNMPIPYKRERFVGLRFAEYTDGEGKTRTGCFFSLMQIPFQMKFGRDRSNNQAVVRSLIEGKYKMCTSSIKIDGKKIYLLLCVDMPKKEYEPIEGKFLYCYLGSASPLFCTPAGVKDLSSPNAKFFNIGSAEEFLYRRREIQAAVRRCQVNNRYSKGGKGRKKKCQAIDRWHDVENNYIDTKLHTYSRMLVDLAVKHKCSKIYLMEQIERENETKEDGNELVLRNWSYYGLIEKIKYKAKMYGIDVVKN